MRSTRVRRETVKNMIHGLPLNSRFYFIAKAKIKLFVAISSLLARRFASPNDLIDDFFYSKKLIKIFFAFHALTVCRSSNLKSSNCFGQVRLKILSKENNADLKFFFIYIIIVFLII